MQSCRGKEQKDVDASSTLGPATTEEKYHRVPSRIQVKLVVSPVLEEHTSVRMPDCQVYLTNITEVNQVMSS